MKNSISTLLLFLLLTSGFSQNSGYHYNGRYTPSIKKEQIKKAKFINEIMPYFSRYVALPLKESVLLNQQLKLVNSPKGYYIYPQESFYPQDNYEKIIEFLSLEISAVCNGKTFVAKSKREALTSEQKNMLSTADPGSDIRIKMKFKYKYDILNPTENKIQEGSYIVTVVPETEAVYPGGFKQMTDYLVKNMINKIPEPNRLTKIQNAIVTFTVNEDGKVGDAKMTQTSGDAKLDNLILDATSKMPTWKPAKNGQGEKIKQQFTIPFGGGGC